jgi:hypothetical protein
LVDKYCRSDPSAVRVEPNIAVVARLGWRGNQLFFADMSALVAEGHLDEYYLDGNVAAVHLRLDLSYEALGDPFSHPLPHMHLGGIRGLRFALEGGNSGNVVVDFLEFIYRSYVPRKWLAWARREWLRRQRENQKAAVGFDRVVGAFLENKFHLLRENALLISQIKRALRESKDSLFAAHMDGPDREILECPSSR